MNANTHRPASIEQATVVSKDHIDEELQRYDAYLRDLRGLSPGSRSSCLRVARRLLRQKFGNGAVDIARLRPADVRKFLADQLEARQTPSNASTLASGLRSYFRYRSACGDPADRLTAVISSPAHWNLASLPRADGGRGGATPGLLQVRPPVAETRLCHCSLRAGLGVTGRRNRPPDDQRHRLACRDGDAEGYEVVSAGHSALAGRDRAGAC